MKQLLAVLLFAGGVLGSTIPVTGFGSFILDNSFDSNASACFSGSDGEHSVSACANDIPAGIAPPTQLYGGLFFSQVMNGWGVIDGITSNHFEFSLGGYGDGFISLMDGQNVLASQAISGIIEITSYQESGTRFANGFLNDGWEASGAFVIVPENGAGAIPVPEPSTGALLWAGSWVALRRKRKTSSNGMMHLRPDGTRSNSGFQASVFRKSGSGSI